MIWMIPALGGAVLAQSTLLSLWFPPRLVPDLALILVVLCGGLRGWRHGLLAGLVGGFVLAVVSAAPLGVHLVRLGAIGAGVGLAGARFERGGPLLPPAVIVVATLVAALLGVVSLQAAGWIVALSGPAAAEFALQALVNALVGLAVLPVLRRVLLREPTAGAEEVPIPGSRP